MMKKEILKLNFDPSKIIKSQDYKDYINDIAKRVLIDNPSDDYDSNVIASIFLISTESEYKILEPELLKLLKEFAPKYMQKIIVQCLQDGADNLYNKKYFDDRISIINIEKEIKNIESLFSDNDLSSYSDIITTFNRGLALASSQLSDREFLSQARIVFKDPERFDKMLNKISDDEIHDGLVNPIINSNNLITVSPSVREHISHYTNGIPLKSFEYCCQSEPFFNALLEYKKYLETIHCKKIKTNINITTKSENTVPFSFTYKYKKGNQISFGFLNESLREEALIDTETKTDQIKAIFSGKKVNQKVIWISDLNELAYFVNCFLIENSNVIQFTRHKWIVTCNCFVLRDKKNNNLIKEIDPDQLAKAIKPIMTFSKIERIASILTY